MDKKTHFFFAFSLPMETKLKLKEVCTIMKERFPFQRWVHFEDLHITLAFLGAADERKLEAAKNSIEERLTGHKSFPLHIHELGVFGREEAPRIFWANTYTENRLTEVRDIVFSACQEAGFDLETRPFKPHITLARKWIGTEPFDANLLIHKNPFKEESIFFTANEVVLFQTHLDRTPKYERKAIFPLANE